MVAASAGRAPGILQQDRGRVYGGIILDYDLRKGLVTMVKQVMSGREVAAAILRWVEREVLILVPSVSSQATALAATLERGGFSVTRIAMTQLTREQFPA